MNDVDLDTVYRQVENAVAKEIENELMITISQNEAPCISHNSIYMINQTGSIIWKRINGQTRLKELIKNLSEEYNASIDRIENDVIAMIRELLQKNLITPIE